MSENFFHGDLSVPEEDTVYFLSFKSCGKKFFLKSLNLLVYVVY